MAYTFILWTRNPITYLMRLVGPKRHFRNNKTEWSTAIFVLLIAVVGFSIRCEWLDRTSSLAMLGGGATMYLGLLNFWLQRDKMMQDLFIRFNDRYDELNDSLHRIKDMEGRNEQPAPEEYENPCPRKKSDEQVVMDYLNLCAEEYFWRQRGRIDEDVWCGWKSGIELWMRVDFIRNIAVKEKPATTKEDSYYGLFDALSIEE